MNSTESGAKGARVRAVNTAEREILAEAQASTSRQAWALFQGASREDSDHARAVFDAVLRRVGR